MAMEGINTVITMTMRVVGGKMWWLIVSDPFLQLLGLSWVANAQSAVPRRVTLLKLSFSPRSVLNCCCVYSTTYVLIVTVSVSAILRW